MTCVNGKAVATALLFAVATAIAWQASAGGDLVTFPGTYKEGVHYATVHRGNIREELYTSRAAIDAAKKGQPFPAGTVITLVDYRNGKLSRYVLMGKRTGWGAAYPPELRNGEWEYQAFNANKSVNTGETLDRCFSCHKSQASQDFVYTVARMKSPRKFERHS